ncbi:hypothetical protein BGX24_004408, partial [Mortierella sp. AD032]
MPKQLASSGPVNFYIDEGGEKFRYPAKKELGTVRTIYSRHQQHERECTTMFKIRINISPTFHRPFP